MRLHRPADRPWDSVRLPPAWATGLPELGDLEREPQLGAVALLQAAAGVTGSALQSRHGVEGDPSDEVFEHPDCAAPFIARLVILRCKELAELLAAYRIAIQQAFDSQESDDF